MQSLRILVPDGTTNYVENPSFRYDTAGWDSFGATLSRTLEEARFNVASLQVVTDGIVIGEGAFYRVSALSGISDHITGSAYVRGSGTVRIRMIDNPAGKQWSSDAIELRNNRWQRVWVSGYTTGSDDIRLYIETYGKVQETTFYVDGVQIERKPYPTTFCDGDQRDCFWNVMDGSSRSTRIANTRSGGRWIELAGCNREESNIYFTVLGGLGVAPMRNDIQSYADSPGSFYQGTKILDRVVTISFFAKNHTSRRGSDVSLRELHALRQALFDIFKPDRVGGRQEFLIEYKDGERPIYFRARYDGGFEGEWDVRNQWINSFPLRLLAVSPMMFEDDQEVQTLSFRSRETVNYVIQRFDGQWSEMNGGLDGAVYDFEIGPRGEIIACGAFMRANNKAGAVDPLEFVDYISYWDGTQWNKYGAGANNVINAIAVAPNGDIYATGAFTIIGGGAANRVAKWDASSGSWGALGTGLNGVGQAIRIAANGDVYVGGLFTTAGGVSTAYIARWDGLQWRAVGHNAGLNNYVYALAISQDGETLYVGGAFTDEYGSPGVYDLNYVAQYDITNETWYEMSSGFNGTVLGLEIDHNGGTLYACGEFTTDGAAGEQTLLYIASWNGAQWSDLSSGADDTVRGMGISKAGVLIAAGDFLRIGGVDAPYLAMWNGSVWVSLDINAGSAAYAAIFDRYGNIYAGCGTTVDIASVTEVENVGTAETSPRVYIRGPATLKWIENQTSKRRVYADMAILDGEDILIDFAQGSARSSVRGELVWSILVGSEFRAWKLLPGINKIAALMDNEVSAQMQIAYTPAHWSADATEPAEAL